MSTMDEERKINGRTPVFNDVLAFVHSKVKLCTECTLVDVISTFYPIEDLEEAKNILFDLIDPQGKLQC